ncbi:MAG: enoyl-CoA hydratase/isomerase family protein [Dehalococcoidia bacterium]|nr:enoyl-CoA hydratase/isomerase family protein [Dehalococcoidia bacterium]
MTGFATIEYRKAGAVAYVSLNRPRSLNAYNLEMRDELYQVLLAITDDPDVGAAVLRGEGRAFCAGADLTEFGTAPSPVIARQVRRERDVWQAFLEVPVPMIAAVQGYCVGSGLEMALLCDLRIASEDAVFAMPEAGLGMIPAAGGTQTIPRHTGPAGAMDLLLTRRRVAAPEALELGLVGRVVPVGRLDHEARTLAEGLASAPREAVVFVKEAVRRGADLPLTDALELEARLAAGTMAVPEA